MEVLGLPLPGKIVIQKQHHGPGGIAEICATIKDLRDAAVEVPRTSPSNFLSAQIVSKLPMEEEAEREN